MSMKVVLRRVSNIKPYAKNPRINEDAVDAVAASIQEYGFRQPIVVDKKGVIIAGHTRWKAAKKLGLRTVPVHVARELSAKQIRAYRLADNATRDRSGWDYELLPIELGKLEKGGYDLGLIGFQEDELAAIMQRVNDGLTDEDAIPAPPDKAITRMGDVWKLGDHRLLCGDAGSGKEVKRLLAGADVHLINTDPPYNVKLEPRSGTAMAGGGSGALPVLGHHQLFDIARGKKSKPKLKMRPRDRTLVGDFLPPKEFDELVKKWFGNLAHVLLPGRSFYIWGGYTNIFNFPRALETTKLYFSQAVIWVKEHPTLTRKEFMGNHEWCFYGWKKGAAHYFNPGIHNAPDVWRLSRADQGTVQMGMGVRLERADGSRIDVLPPEEKRRIRHVNIGEEVALYSGMPATDVWAIKKISPQSMIHLTEKPVELAVRAMTYSSRPGENVLDLFAGAGGTLIAAEKIGRRAFLMEIDELYCDVIVKRWEAFTGKKAKRGRRARG